MRVLASFWFTWWKTLAIVLSIAGGVVLLHLALPALGPISNKVEAELHAWSATERPITAALGIVGAHLWSAGKMLAFPAGVLAVSLLVEIRFSEAEREPKVYWRAAVIQAGFYLVAYAAIVMIDALLPIPQFTLIKVGDQGGPLLLAGSTVAAVALYLVLLDVMLYWAHRAHHEIPILWRFHAVHHSPSDLDALHNYIHPVEQLVRTFTIFIPLQWIIEVGQPQFLIVISLLAIQNQLTHMNVPTNFGILRHVFVDNRHHFIHHGREAQNYVRNYAAIFSFTDRMFHTYHPASAGALPATGFVSSERPARLGDYFLGRVTPARTNGCAADAF